MKKSSFTIGILLPALLLTATFGFAQHRGDNLAFQGLSLRNESGVKALAMGGAYTSITGEVASLFYNPAGLADVQKFQLSVSANRYKKLWRENQVFRTNRLFLTLPFYLERLYIPNPENNGQWDYEIFIRERDSSYVVQDPKLGAEPYSSEAAEWEKTTDDFLFDHIAAALPLNVAGKDIVLSAAYHRSYDVLDFDRNDTYLDPHVGYDEYGVAERVSNDTLRMDWYTFQRQRSGTLHSLTAAVAYKVNRNIKLGVGFASMSGETQDAQQLDKVGWFDLTKNNRFRFSYDTLNTSIKGTSKFSATSLNVGTVLTFDHFSFGFNYKAGYTLKRSWQYSTVTTDTLQSLSSSGSGEDKMSVPAGYRLGVTFMPVQQFLISFDYESTPYSRASFSLASNDSTHRDWVDQGIVRFGLEYRPKAWLSLLAGYRNMPTTFVPDGAAFKDRGPAAESFTAGISLRTGSGRLDVAYEIRRLKYYDSYYSNTNYALEAWDNLVIGYMLEF